VFTARYGLGSLTKAVFASSLKGEKFSYFITLAKTKSKLPEDDAEAPKHIGAFVI